MATAQFPKTGGGAVGNAVQQRRQLPSVRHPSFCSSKWLSRGCQKRGRKPLVCGTEETEGKPGASGASTDLSIISKRLTKVKLTL